MTLVVLEMPFLDEHGKAQEHQHVSRARFFCVLFCFYVESPRLNVSNVGLLRILVACSTSDDGSKCRAAQIS